MPARRNATGDSEQNYPIGPPASTPEEREQQLTALAYDLVEQRLREGTATSQETTYFLKRGGARERLEERKLVLEAKLLEAREEQLGRGDRMEELLDRAVKAFKGYSGEEMPPEEGEVYG